MNLTTKQKLFCDSFIIFDSVEQAAKASGYSKSFAYSLLKKQSVKDYISSKSKPLDTSDIANSSEILQYLTQIIRAEYDAKLSVKDKIKAAELLGKALSVFNPTKTNQENFSPVVFVDENSISN